MKQRMWPVSAATFRILHAWGGVTLALLLMLSSATGTLLLWKQQYVWFTTPQAHVEFTATPAALARIAAAVDTHFDPDQVLGIIFATADFPLTKVIMADARYAYLDVEGGIVAQWVQNERWEEWLYDLHHRLLLDDFGLTLLGLAAIALMILVAAGVIAFWPLRQRFRQGIVPKDLARPRLLVAHRNLGIVLALPLLLTLLTGTMLAFPQQIESLLLDTLRRSPAYSDALAENLDNVSGPGSGDWLPAMERALASFPAAQIRSAQVPSSFSPYRIIGLKQPEEWHQNGLSLVYIDAGEGYMDIRIDATALPLRERFYNAGNPLHTGNTGSALYRWLLTISGVLISLLSGMGLLAFIRRYR